MRRLAALCCAVLALAGCSLGDNAAEQVAKEHAKDLGRRMTAQSVQNHTALDLVRRVGGEGVFLRAEGVAGEEDMVLVARISTEAPSGGGWTYKMTKATMCFEYRIGEYGEGAESPKVVDCPAGPPLVLPKQSPPPSLANVSLDDLITALERRSSRFADPAAVRSAVETSVAEPSAAVDAMAVDGWIGFSVRAGSDCILGRVRDKAVEVWVPPAVTIQPGELTCTTDTAGHGLAQRSPH